MHALIAISTMHLRRLAPSYKPDTLPETYHWQRTVDLFQKEIDEPIGLHNMDAVLSTSMLLAVLAFTYDDHSVAGSWIFSPTQSSANWLYVQGGLLGILIQCAAHLDQSIWIPVLNDADDYKGTFSNEDPGPEGLPAAFVDLCEIDASSSGKNNPYHLPLRTLAPLLDIQPSAANYYKLVTIVGRISGQYRDLVQQKDPRALLILSYWFGLMCGVDLWWVRTRVRTECVAICMFLEHHHDPRIVKLLEFPAHACGYCLKPPPVPDGYLVELDVDSADFGLE